MSQPLWSGGVHVHASGKPALLMACLYPFVAGCDVACDAGVNEVWVSVEPELQVYVSVQSNLCEFVDKGWCC